MTAPTLHDARLISFRTKRGVREFKPSLWIDPNQGVSTNILGNGGFETAGAGGADVFASWVEGVAGGSVISDELAEMRSGAHCCKWVIDDVGTTGSLASIYQLVMTAGMDYTLDFYAKRGVGTTTIATSQGIPAQSFTITDSWVKYTKSFTATSTRAQIQRGTAPERTIYIDDFSLYRTGVATNNQTCVLAAAKQGGTWSQDSVIAQPLYLSSEVNGRAALQFDGSSTYMKQAAAALSSTTTGRIQIVAQTDEVDEEQILYSQADEGSETAYLHLGISSTNKIAYWFNNAGTEVELLGNADLGTDWHVLEWVSDGSAITMFVDGSQQNLTDTNTNNNGDWFGDVTGTDNSIIGASQAHASTVSGFLTGCIAEIVAVEPDDTAANMARLRRTMGRLSGTTLASALLALTAAGEGILLAGGEGLLL